MQNALNHGVLNLVCSHLSKVTPSQEIRNLWYKSNLDTSFLSKNEGTIANNIVNDLRISSVEPVIK